MAISDAVGLERLSKILGYKIEGTNFSNSTPNLPQRIVVLGEATTAKQTGLITTGVAVTSAKQAGDLYGYGSPIERIMSILRPKNGGVGGIPTIVFAQSAAGGAAAKVLEATVTGTATANGTHTLVIAGREGIAGVAYDVNIVKGDTATQVASKAKDAINAVLGAPVIATSTAAVLTATAKWAGLTSNELTITVLTNGNDLGITWAVVQTAAGSGTPSIQAALDQFGSAWNTIVINSYGTVTATMTALEDFNGIPSPTIPSGRYAGEVMKPFIALTGSTAADPSSITDPRSAQVTIAICPAPNSKGFSFEAAANMAVLFARTCQDTPELDVSGNYYPDMPVPLDGVIGVMSNYNDRDAIIKKGCSTVDLVAGRYLVQDFVTTYHPQGEEPAQFRYCRNLNLDWNVRYTYYLLEQKYVVDHVLCNDNDVVARPKIVKPKGWKGVLVGMAKSLAERALIADPDFTADSIQVQISNINPSRFETLFDYKRTEIARIASTTARAGFNFGPNN